MSVTLFNPPGIETSGSHKVGFVSVFADPSAPTAAELNAGLDLSKVLDTFPTTHTQATSTTARVGDEQLREHLGKATATVGPISYVYDPQMGTEDPNYAYYSGLEPKLVGWMYDRRGIDTETPFAADQYVDLYPVKLGIRSRSDVDPNSTDAQFFKVEQIVAVTGPVLQDIKVAAGA